MTPPNRRPSPPPGLVTGGRGGPDDELLIDGQEEVFARTEVELGRIEHDTTAGSGETSNREPADDSGAEVDRMSSAMPAEQPRGDSAGGM